jgi:hypothetical protein
MAAAYTGARYNFWMRSGGGLVIALAAGGCWTDARAPAPLVLPEPPPAHPVANRPLFTITEAAFGPLDANTPATLDALRRVLPGYTVKPVNDGSLEYDVFAGAERLFYVVPSDDGTLFNIHAVSGKIAVAGRRWRAGEPFHDSLRLTQCECWGANPTCFAQGEHVAVNFGRECEGVTDLGGDPAGRSFDALDGLPIARVIWSAQPFGNDPNDGTPDPPSMAITPP